MINNQSWGHDLFSSLPNSNLPMVEGQWFTIQLMPDLVAGEIFNIGIVFIKDGVEIYYKIIPNSKPFFQLYGSNGIDNFNFLLSIVRKRLQDGLYEKSPSPNVIYNQPAFASGTTVDEILNSLYETMIRLNFRSDEDAFSEKNYCTSTNKIRSSIFSKIRKEMPNIYENIYNPSPKSLFDQKTKKDVLVDLPIWNGRGNIYESKNLCFGSIVSAAYKDQIHRGYHIDHGCTDIRNACLILGKNVKAGLIIYRPSEGSDGFNQQLQDQIDADIDRSLNSLLAMQREDYHISITVTDKQEEIVKGVLALS